MRVTLKDTALDKCVLMTDLEDRWKNGIFIMKSARDVKEKESNWKVEPQCPIFTTDEGRDLIRELTMEVGDE